MVAFKYDLIRDDFIRRMNALLVRAKNGDTNCMEEWKLIKDDLDSQVASGFVDWESDIDQHLKMLKYWCEKARG